MTRDEALKLVKEKVQNQKLIKHCLAVEAIMKAMAEKLNQDVLNWSLTGLLHDIDYEETKDKPEEHSLVGGKILEDLGLIKHIVQAVKAHNEIHGLPRESLMAKVLSAVDPLSGLITASALILPSKKLADVQPDSILKRFKEPRFAAGANRQAIQSIEAIGLTLEQFITVSLKAMQEISNDLGL